MCIFIYAEGEKRLNMTIITVGTVTTAMKVKRLLQRNKIQSRLIKVEPLKEMDGCTHGIEFESKYFYFVVNELIKEDIKYSLYSQR